MLTLTIDKAKIGDMSALSSLYDASYDRIYRYIFHRTFDTIQTEDIMSEVSMKIVENIKKFRGSTEGEYYAWVFQICYTTIIDHSKKNIGVDSLEDIIWEPIEKNTTGSLLDSKEKLREVLEYLKSLSEKERTIITMRVWDDLSYEEIAAITHESETNIRKIVSRTLIKISANVSALSLLIFLIYNVR